MTNLPDGRYFILLATSSAPLPLPVGVNLEGSTPPIIVGGKDCIWTVKKLDSRKYTVILEQTGLRWFSQAPGSEVFVAIKPVAIEWTIRGQANGTYSIEKPSELFPTKAWTLDSTEPGTRVTPGVYEFPIPGQLWNFVPVLED